MTSGDEAAAGGGDGNWQRRRVLALWRSLSREQQETVAASAFLVLTPEQRDGLLAAGPVGAAEWDAPALSEARRWLYNLLTSLLLPTRGEENGGGEQA